MSYVGTKGWHTCQSLSARRLGIPGPDASEPLEGSPLYYAVKVRTHGDHTRHRSIWEWDAAFGSWMLLVLDGNRNIVGQVFGRTQPACHRKMNAIYADKRLGVYNRQYLDDQQAP